MRTVTVDDVDFEIRPLKRKEVRELRKAGMPLNNLTSETADACMDRVFSMVFDDTALALIDEMDNPDALMIWRECLKETFGSRDEEKN